jgi:hypothetical protein
LDSDSDEESALPFFAAATLDMSSRHEDEEVTSEENLRAFFESRLLDARLAETLASLLGCDKSVLSRHFDPGACVRSPLHVAAATAAIQRVETHDHFGLSSLRIEWVKLTQEVEEESSGQRVEAERLLHCHKALAAAGRASTGYFSLKDPSPPKRTLTHSQSLEPVVRKSMVRTATIIFISSRTY